MKHLPKSHSQSSQSITTNADALLIKLVAILQKGWFLSYNDKPAGKRGSEGPVGFVLANNFDAKIEKATGSTIGACVASWEKENGLADWLEIGK